MPPKRKQPDGDTAIGSHPHTPVKKAKTSSLLTAEATSNASKKRKHPAGDPVAESSSSTPAKKVKPTPKPLIKATAPATSERKTSTKPSPTKSTLVPRGNRKRAMLGQQDDSLLRMLCDDSKTGEVKELHFRKIPHSMIDWSNAQHIGKINAWRNQIYGRAGLKAKSVTMWHEQEELWFELYFQLSIAESQSHGILLPKTGMILNAFNETFVGCVLKDKDGHETEARPERQTNAFASKFSRVCPQLKTRLAQCVFGKSGDIFVPGITLNMLVRYKAMKVEMAAKGIDAESAYSNNLEEWQYFLSHLPASNDAEMQKISEEMTQDMIKTKEEDAAAALVSLANPPVNVQETVRGEGELVDVSMSNNYGAELKSAVGYPQEIPSAPTTPHKEKVTTATIAGDQCPPVTPKNTIPNSVTDADKENTIPELTHSSPTRPAQHPGRLYTPAEHTQSFGDHTKLSDEVGYKDLLIAGVGNEKTARAPYCTAGDNSAEILPSSDFYENEV